MIKLLRKILKINSVTPNDNKCQFILSKYLKLLGFEVFTIIIKNVTNSVFIYRSFRSNVFKYSFLGHTDVVGVNLVNKWSFPPFGAKIVDGRIFARGTVDMKCSIICFIYSFRIFLKTNFVNSNYCILLTSDEEGKAKNGSFFISFLLTKKNYFIENCLIGEPTSENRIFDFIKNGRKGSSNIKFFIYGLQGHSAYINKTINSLHISSSLIHYVSRFNTKNNCLSSTVFNNNNNTLNVIPSLSYLNINIRFVSLRYYFYFLIKIYRKMKLNNFSFFQYSFSLPFYLDSKDFILRVKKIPFFVNSIIDSTKGGTSDGRFLYKNSANLLEIGFRNNTAHKYNENVSLKSIYKMLLAYYFILIS